MSHLSKGERGAAPAAANSGLAGILRGPELHLVETEATREGTRRSGSRHQKRILVVDDEVVHLQVLANLLSLQDCAVVTACTGAEALAHINAAESYDLVIIDITLPDMSGYEVCRLLRARYSLCKLPVLLVTVQNRLEGVTAGLEAGANDYVTKPFAKRELLARVETLLTLKRSVSLVVANTSRLEAEKEQRLLAERLRDVPETVTSTLDLPEVLVRLLDNLKELVAYSSAAVLLRQNGSC